MIETIENDWDTLFRDHPERYDEFANVEMQPAIVEVINQHFPLKGKVVLDVGSGTGAPTFRLAHYAGSVIGVEPEGSMRAVAEKQALARGIKNVKFIEGRAEEVPLPDNSVDLVTAITLQTLYTEENIQRFAAEAERVVRPGGQILSLNIAPFWYGGELGPIIYGGPRKLVIGDQERDTVFAQLGFAYLDFDSLHCYGTVEKAVRTYGFIFGRNAINHIQEHAITAVTFRYRIHYKSK